jgi:hypothetical protein
MAISPDCEVALDHYEGWPTLYRKETLPISGITWMLNDITAMPAEVIEIPAMHHEPRPPGTVQRMLPESGLLGYEILYAVLEGYKIFYFTDPVCFVHSL